MISASELLVTAFSVLGLRAVGMAAPDHADAPAAVPAPLPELASTVPLDPMSRNAPAFEAVASALREAGCLCD